MRDGSIECESAFKAIIEIYSTPENPLWRQDAERIISDEPDEEKRDRNAGLSPEGKHAAVVASPRSGSSNGSKPKTNGAHE